MHAQTRITEHRSKFANTKRRQISCTNLDNRAQEQVANTERRQVSRTNLDNRAKEHVTNMKRRRIACTKPENRAQEQFADKEQRQIACTNLMYQMATKFDVSSGTYLYHQPCGVWSIECRHGCGYTHLSSSTRSTRNKCCVDNLLSSCSPNLNEDATIKFVMEQFPVFMRLVGGGPVEKCFFFKWPQFQF